MKDTLPSNLIHSTCTAFSYFIPRYVNHEVKTASLNSIRETLKATERVYNTPTVYVNSFHTNVMFNNNVTSYEDKLLLRNNQGERKEPWVLFNLSKRFTSYKSIYSKLTKFSARWMWEDWLKFLTKLNERATHTNVHLNPVCCSASGISSIATQGLHVI
jgi:hypothetical protein